MASTVNEKFKEERTLGLPPMQLAEGNNANSSQRCLQPWLQKVIWTVILTIMSVGFFVLLTRIIFTADKMRSTEIVVFSSTGNITVQRNDVEILVHWKNKSSHQFMRRKRSAETIKETQNKSIGIDDDVIKQAREVVLSHKGPCTKDTQDETCKDLVTKLRSVIKRNSENSQDSNSKNTPTSPKSINEDTKVPSVLSDSSARFNTEERSDYPYAIHESQPAAPEYQAIPPPIVNTCILAKLLKQNPQLIQGIYSQPLDYYPHQPAEVPYLPSHDAYPSYGPSHPHSSYLQNRLADLHEHRPHPQDIDIFMRFHSTTEPAKSVLKEPHAATRQAECQIGTISCNDGEKCVSDKQWCDGTVDCTDTSDELSCSCKSRIDSSRLCDGYFDCPFGEDEIGCHGCAEGTFSCEDLDLNTRSTCFTREQRCDNIVDCPNHKDEIECNLLAPSLHEKPIFAVSNTEGFLQRNYKGSWYPVCNNPYMWAHDACRRETGLIIRPPFIQMVPIDPSLKVTYLNTGPGGVMQMSETCVNASAVYVTCPDLLCGTRVPTTSQLLRGNNVMENRLFGRNRRHFPNNNGHFYPSRGKRHINNVTDEDNKDPEIFRPGHIDWRMKRAESRVVGGRPSQPAAWPWMIAMYRDGMFHCGGVILKDRWIISAAHCVHKFWEHYYEVRVGMLRRFSYSPQESNHHVTHVIVNPKYDRVDMKNDLSLLRVKPAIQFSRWVRPICLPSPNTVGRDWMWGPQPGTVCTAVGWGSTVEHGPDPDHMREVEVPVWESCKHKEDRSGKEICAGLLEGGKDACQGDSGGPLLCRNPMNAQQWYMAGIVSHGDGCGRKGEPGVYTRVSLFDKWIKFNIYAKSLPAIQPKQECPGFMCESGIPKCLPKKRLCDKIVDCMNGEDEMNCNTVRTNQDSTTHHVFSELGEDNIFMKKSHLETKEAAVDDNIVTIKDVTATTDPTSSESNSESHENVGRHASVEDLTENPNNEETSRGDLEMMTLTNSKEILESRSIVTDPKQNNKSDTTVTDVQVTTNTTQSLGTINSTLSTTEDNRSEIFTTIQNTVVIDSTTKRNSRELGNEIENTTGMNMNNSNQANQSNKNNTTIEKESKELSIDLPLDDNENDRPNETEKLSKDLLEPEQKYLVDKIKEIIAEKLLPAKIKKKHHKPTVFECGRIPQIIPYKLRCNYNADCEDGTDELGCSCVDYLTTYDESLLCDGGVDCADGLDESNCYGCADDQFLCKWSKTCLTLKHVCDGTPHCPQGEDELDCFALSNGKTIDVDFDGKVKVNLEGYLTRKYGSHWNIVCENNLSPEQQEESADHICRYLGFSNSNRHHVKHINIKDEHISKHEDRRRRRDSSLPIHFMYKAAEKDDSARHIVIKDPEVIKEQCVPNVTKTCMSLYVYCEHTLFTNNLNFQLEDESNLNNVIFARTAGRTWPWIAKVFVEGEYRCTGILVDLSWVLVSQSCLWDSLLIQNYVTVVLGSQKILRASHGPYEQTYEVNGKKDLYHSKVTLLHLRYPAHHSAMVKPMVVSSMSDTNAEENSICLAVGQDDNNDTISVFLEETDENCPSHNRCFIRRRPKTLCSRGVTLDRAWRGIVTCHGQVGWHPAASFVESKGECGLGDKIVGVDVGNLKSDIKHYIGKAMSESTEQITSDTCDGGRCGRGRCVSTSQLCNGVRDCEDGTDESDESCDKKRRFCKTDPHHRGCDCNTSELKCKNGKCIPKEHYGDGREDCGDGSDEPGLGTCSQYLARTKPNRLCDGILHCHDKTDEDPLFCKCFSKNSYRCGASEHCVAPDLTCDGSRDCPNGEDEMTCIGLSSLKGTPDGTGEVIVRSHGVWHSKCYPKQNHTRSELEEICRELGFISGHAKQLRLNEKSIFVPRKTVVLNEFSHVQLNNITSVRMRNSDMPLARLVVDENEQHCHPVYIECL